MATESPSQLRPGGHPQDVGGDRLGLPVLCVCRAAPSPLLSTSTDPRQRVTDQLVHHPPPAEARLHQHHPGRARCAPRRSPPPPRSRAPPAAPPAPRPRRPAATNATSLPSLATYIGSIPRISAAPATAGLHRAPRLAHDHRDRRRAGQLVQHRRHAAAGGVAHAAQLGPAASSSASTAGHSERVSDSISASSSNSPRASMIAVPCSPMLPDSRMRSPGRRPAGESCARDRGGRRRSVHTYMPSAWPRSTTLVSPATTSTPAASRGGGRSPRPRRAARRRAGPPRAPARASARAAARRRRRGR